MDTAAPSGVTSAALPWVKTALERGDTRTQVEADVVLAFATSHDLTPAAGSRIDTILRNGRQDAAQELLTAVPSLTLNDVVMVFETLVPDEEASLYGANFTPAALTTFMASEAINILATRRPLTGVRVVDAAVGCGALLVAALQELVTRTGEAPHTVASRFTGVDISADSVRRAQVLLDVACLTLGDDTEPHPTLLVGDALTATTLTETNVLDGHEFDLVLMNPPYVRFQRLPHKTRVELPQAYRTVGTGNFNLYFPFFEIAAHLTASDGVIAFITPNGFFTSKSAAPLRAWFADTALLDDIVDFGHHRVFTAMTYTAITFLTPKNKPPTQPTTVRYTTVEGLPGLARITGTNWRTNAATLTLPPTATPWTAVASNQTSSIALITAQPRTLADIADIRYGIATCRDRLYLLTGQRNNTGQFIKHHNGIDYPIEPAATAPCVRVSNLATQHDLDTATTRIIYPYHRDGTTITVIPEQQMQTHYPHTYTYLQAVKHELAQRDKGKKTYPEWFAYARTQGLRPLSPKLLSPLYGDEPRFLTSTDPDLLFLNGVAITPKPDSDLTLDDIAAILNSTVCQHYIHNTGGAAINGGYHAYQKTQLSGLGIPPANHPQWENIRNATTPQQRDNAIRALYGLPPHTP